MTTPTPKQTKEEILVPNFLDEMAKTHSSEECFSIPRTNSPADGWTEISWSRYANAINRVAQEIIDACGLAKSDTFPTIAYIGPNDCRYLVFVVAAVKAGYKVIFLGPFDLSPTPSFLSSLMIILTLSLRLYYPRLAIQMPINYIYSRKLNVSPSSMIAR